MRTSSRRVTAPDSRTVIRRAVPTDSRRVAQILAEAFEEFRPSYTSRAFVATTPDEEAVRQRFEEGPLWIAVQTDQAVGTVSATPRGRRTLYLRSMAVIPEARGKGIGRLLLKEAEDYAVSAGYATLFLCTTPFLFCAIRLYESFGFKTLRDRQSDLFGTALLSMAKPLSREEEEGAR